MKRKSSLSIMWYHVLTFLIQLTMFMPVFAQEEAEPQVNQYKGIVFDKERGEKEVIIETNLAYPWITQKYIRYFDDSLLQSGERVRLRNKPKYDAKEIAGFRLEDKLYEAHKYSDLTELSLKSAGAYYFFEVAMYGRIKLYKYYESPPVVMQGDPEITYEELRNNPQILIKKGDSKLDVVSSSMLEKFISDCPAVLEKYNKGEYGNKTAEQADGKKKSKLRSLIKLVADGPSVNSYVFEVVTEYNTIMSEQN